MSLSAGERNHRISFQKRVTLTNELNEIVGSDWADVVSVWARKTNQLSATAEAVASGANAYREQVKWDILPRDIDPTWRIVHKGKVYDIKSVGASNDRSETAIIAVAGLNPG